MVISIPDKCLVTLVGVSGAGKSTVAGAHFWPSEIVSSDQCRLMVADDEGDQTATADAFSLLHYIVERRMARGRLTVVDATNLLSEDRQPLFELAAARHIPAVALVLDVPLEVCVERNHRREFRQVPVDVLRTQGERAARVTEEQLRAEGCTQVVRLSVADVAELSFNRARRVGDLPEREGPFDIVGDVHGCLDELAALLGALGYEVASDRSGARHPEGRVAVFVGDLVDRGPATPDVLRLVMGMVREGHALCVPGNHEARVLQALRGQEVPAGHGLAEALEQLAGEPEEARQQMVGFIEGLPSHLILDGGQLVVAHAGMPEEMQNRDSTAVRRFALYGDTTGETDEMGMPVRYPWARDYRGSATVVYGHTPVTTPAWDNGTICIDTGCVYGGMLTALRYPECEVVSVPAARTYYTPRRQFTPVGQQSSGQHDAVPEVAGGEGRSGTPPAGMPPEPATAPPSAPAEAEGEAAAPGVSPGSGPANGSGLPTPPVNGSAVAAGARSNGSELTASGAAAPVTLDSPWVVYVPPAVPPGPPGPKGEPEHPAAAFMVFAEAGVSQAVCEYLHQGVRAVAVLCRDPDVAAARFGAEGALGGFYGADGAPLPEGLGSREAFEGLHSALTQSGLWSELEAVWLVLEVILLSDGRMAPVTVLAGSSGVWTGHDRRWHLAVAQRLNEAAPRWVVASRSTQVQLDDVLSRAEAIAWWQDVLSGGGAGMVVRPTALSGLTEGVPPAMVCRRRGSASDDVEADPFVARESAVDNLVRRHVRATRAAALGEEGLRRLVTGEPLEQVRTCCREVLALERQDDLPVAGA